MRKVLGQTLVLCALVVAQLSLAEGGPLPTMNTAKSYKILKPILNAIGFRPLSIHVYNAVTKAPLSDATVMIGEAENTPFQNNWKQTDAEGNVSFDGFAIESGPQTVSVRHENYSGYTIFKTSATSLEIPLTPLVDTTQKTTLRGTFTNWPKMEDFDDIIHVGLLLPSINIIDIIDFRPNKLLAPDVKAFVYRERDMPGNLVFPSQEESYLGLVSVYISKPNFVMPFRTGATQDFIALSGQVPLSDIVRGYLDQKPLTDLLNLVNLNRFGIKLNYTVPEGSGNFDIDMSDTLSSRYVVESRNHPANKDRIFASLSSFKEKPASVIPLDFKVQARNSLTWKSTLKSIYSRQHLPATQDVLMVLAADLPKNSEDKRKRDMAMTGVLKRPTRFQFNLTAKGYLDLHDLSFEPGSAFQYTVRSRASETDVHMNMSFINHIVPGQKKGETHQKTLWTVVTPASMEAFEIPQLPEGLSELPDLNQNEEFKWVLNRFGFYEKGFTFDYNDMNADILGTSLTHFSRNHIVLSRTEMNGTKLK